MTRARRSLGIAMGVVLLLAIFAGGWLAGRLGIGSVVDPASLTDLERHFTERMRDVTMIGAFMVAGREDRTPRRRGRISRPRPAAGAAGRHLQSLVYPVAYMVA